MADGHGIPLHVVAARAGDHDSPLLEPTLTGICELIGTLPQYRDLHGGDDFPNVHLDRGYDSAKTRDLVGAGDRLPAAVDNPVHVRDHAEAGHALSRL